MAFYYCGWDVSSNLNEESKNGHKSAGLGGFIGVVIVFALFEAFTIAVNVTLSAGTIQHNSGNVLGELGDALWPGAGGKILIVAVMLSTVATLETTLIQVTRSLFAMGRDVTQPRIFGRIHRQWRTPRFATVAVAAVSLGLFIASNFLGSLSAVLGDAISAIGLQIAVYYALAIGIVPMVIYWRRGSPYYSRRGASGGLEPVPVDEPPVVVAER